MKLPVIATSLVLASTAAYAQAPGDYEGGELAPPSMVPVAAAPVVAPPPPQRRWSVGIGVGAMDLAPHSAPDNSTSFDVGQLYVRYRPWRRLELELALGGGGESDHPDTGMNGGREVSSAVLALRYRFNPHRRWNFHVMAGMGTLAVTRQDASDEEREAAHQSTLQFGAGVERRWNRFALQFEIRAVGVAPRDEGDEVAPVRIDEMSPSGTSRDDGGMAGGQFVFSGNYYF